MNVGLTVWLDRSVAETARLAMAAEAGGFSDVWLPDHYFLRDVYVAQALMAERTERIRLGTAVVVPLLRHPALIASSTATIAELSAGRAVVGLGSGGFEFAKQLGLRAKSPLSVVRESVEIVRALFEGEATVNGKAFTADGARLGWHAGRLPIYIAARGPRMLELAGEVADGVIVHGLARSHIEFCLERIRRGAEVAGRDPAACELCMMFDVELDDDPGLALERLRPRCTVMAGGTYAEELIPVYGLDPADVSPLREAVRSGDLEHAATLVTDEMVHAFGVAGSEDELARRFAQLTSYGIERAIINVGGAPSIDETIGRIERASTVISGAAA